MKVLIIGAGISGLHAAWRLNAEAHEVTILEASSRIGGRAYSQILPDGSTFEAGAEELHNPDSLLGDMIRKKGIPTEKRTYEEYTYWKGKLTLLEKLERHPFFQPSVKQFEKLESRPLSPRISMAEALTKSRIYLAYQHIARAWIGNEYGTTAANLSAWEWSQTERATEEITSTWLAGHSWAEVLEVLYGEVFPLVRKEAPVVKVSQEAQHVQVGLKDGETIHADAVLITVPLTQLQAQKIQFNPPLPASKQTAIQQLGMDGGIKALVQTTAVKQFPEPFVSIYGGKLVPEYWSNKAGQFTAFWMGNTYQAQPETNPILLIQDELRGMLPLTQQDTCEVVTFQSWKEVPFIEGAYSYAKPGATDMRSLLAAPVGRLYFAGEATHTAFAHATLHGAVDTAERAVKEMLTSELFA
ncbi:MAG: NAD(P)/FAD-dependent oxidoreductase [Bacteroidota bacterium]